MRDNCLQIPPFKLKCEWFALFFLTACFFVSAISVTLTTITYLSAFFFLVFSDNWKAYWNNIKQNNAALSFWLLFSLYIIGIFYSTSTPHHVFQDFQKHHWLLMTPFFIALITEERWRQHMVNSFLCVMIITLFLAYFTRLFHFNILTHIPFYKTPSEDDSVFQNHIIQSFLMNIAAFICAYRFFFNKKYRVLYGILFVLMTVNIFAMSMGRTGYGIYCLLLWYLGAVRFKWKGIIGAPIVGILLIIFACLSSHQFRERMSMIYEQSVHYEQLHTVTSIGQRIEMATITKKMVEKRPWFGYGTGGIRTAMTTVVPKKDRVFNPSIDYVESIYADFLLQFGIFGLIIFFVVIGMQIKASFQLPQHYRYLMHVLLIATLFGGLFNGFFVSFPFSHFYSLFSALCLSSFTVKSL